MKEFIKAVFKRMFIDEYKPTFFEVILPHYLILYILIRLG